MANSGLSEEELAEFREIFNLVDADGSGEISREELGELISTLGLKVRNQFHRA
jgi:Ca2+-binding EF-hand superfamily protein